MFVLFIHFLNNCPLLFVNVMIEVSAVVVSGLRCRFPDQTTARNKTVFRNHIKYHQSLTATTRMSIATFTTLKLNWATLRSTHIGFKPRFPFAVVFIQPRFVKIGNQCVFVVSELSYRTDVTDSPDFQFGVYEEVLCCTLSLKQKILESAT